MSNNEEDVATLTVQLYNAYCHLWNEVPIAYNDIGTDVTNDAVESWAIKSSSLMTMLVQRLAKSTAILSGVYL